MVELVWLIGGPFHDGKRVVAHFAGTAVFTGPRGPVAYVLDGGRRGGLRTMTHRRQLQRAGSALEAGQGDVPTAAS